MDRILLSPTETAEVLGLKSQTVRRMSRDGRLPAPIMIRRSLRWRKLEIEEWVAAQPTESEVVQAVTIEHSVEQT